tara:strand:- start:1012 stop:1245 length:234 start_codon:yes stop_codon:yes gene_type:complete
MELIAFFLFVMIILTLLNGLIFFKKLIKLQEENNKILTKILKNYEPETIIEKDEAMPYQDLEKLKTEFMKKSVKKNV